MAPMLPDAKCPGKLGDTKDSLAVQGLMHRIWQALRTKGILSRGVGFVLVVGAALVWSYGIDYHQTITSAAFNFLRTEIQQDINDEHSGMDVGGLFSPKYHFDGCEFQEAATHINNQYFDPRVAGAGGVLAELDPNDPTPFDATDEFGQLLHTAQDFYAHSNWVDFEPRSVPLYDQGTVGWKTPTSWNTLFRGNLPLILIEGETPPEGWMFTATYLGGVKRGMTVKTGVQTRQGLISGTSWFQEDNCPDVASIDHGSTGGDDDSDTLNKDTPERTNFQAAYNASIRQTRHEWCRLLYLLHDKYGFPGSSIPLGLWVKPGALAHPANSICAYSSYIGSLTAKVSIDRITVLDDLDPGVAGKGELNFVLALYLGDFSRSTRAQGTQVEVNSGETVPLRGLPARRSLLLRRNDTLVMTLQGWEDDSGDGVYEQGDDTLVGVTHSIRASDLNNGVVSLSSRHLQVTFRVVREPL